MSFRAQRGISPFAQRKGARGMLHVIPSAARNLPPSRSVRGLGGCPIIPIKVQNAIITP